MPKTRSGRAAFALIVCAALFVISRNLYRRYLNNALINAAISGDTPAVRSLLDRGADANSVHTFDDGKFRESVLGYALDKSETMACLLIEHGANIQKKPSDNYPTLLRYACQGGRVVLLRCLLEHGANPNDMSSNQNTPLNSALSYRQYTPIITAHGIVPRPPGESARQEDVSRQMAALLLAHGARVALRDAVLMDDPARAQAALAGGENVNEQDRNGSTALHTAVTADKLAMLSVLLAHRANLNLPDNNGVTPLSLAAGDVYGTAHIKAAELLLAAGANVNLAGKYTGTPLIAALSGKHADLARLLLARGADPNHTRPAAYGEGYSGSSALSLAIANLPNLVPTLLAHHAAVNEINGSPLATAIGAKRPDLVRLLLARHADVNGAEGAPLLAAIRAQDPGTARFLLQRGAKINPPRSKVVLTRSSASPISAARTLPTIETTPSTLRVAVMYGPECFDLLMQAGADITPDKPDILLAAASAGHAVLFDRLISLGANVNAADTDGNTALTEAFVHAPDGIRTLLEQGANPNAINRSMQTPLIMAAQTGNAEAARLLIAHSVNVNFKPPHSHTALHFALRHKNNADVVKLLTQAGAKDE